MNEKTKRITTVGMLCAIAYAVMVVGRIPAILFLKYDPKDVVIAIGGFIFGPMTALLVSVIVSTVEMFSVSDTGIIGWVMNILSTCTFVCTASYIYKKKHTMFGAVVGLGAGVILMTGAMLLWNYFVTPIFLGYDREVVVQLLYTAFFPFNLLKGGINSAITVLLYKPVVTALRKAQLVPTPETEANKKERTNLGVTLIAGFVLVSSILFLLVKNNVI